MKTTSFATTTSDLRLILDDTKDLNFKLEIENRPAYGDVLVSITAEENDFIEFIDRNDLSMAISELMES